VSEPFNTDARVTYGVIEAVAPGVRRVTCANPSAMTFTGTRTYLVGAGAVAVIDPGPDDSDHLAAIEAGLGPGERISHILVTHSHIDHSPGARRLGARVGAPVLAFGPHGAGMSALMRGLSEDARMLGGGEGADAGFTPDVALGDTETITGRGWTLRALHTPGHLSNHLCYALEGTGIVFTGDTVMGLATTLVSPPDGDMADLMHSLRRLAGRGDRLLLPGHGHAVDAPSEMIAHQIAHREARLEQIVDKLRTGPADAATLAARIYTEVDPSLLPAATRNVFATLLGLMSEGRVGTDDPLSPEARFALN